MILAAGRGERMRPLTDRTPKPLLEVRGKPLMQYHIEALQRAGYADIVVNTAWLEEQIVERFDAPGIRYSREGRDFGGALETAGGIARALPLLDEVFWVVGGDVHVPQFEFPERSYARFVAGGKLAHIFVVPNPAHNEKGDFALRADGVATREGSPRYTYSTIGLYRKAFFDGLPAGNPEGRKIPMLPLMLAAIEREQMTAEIYTGPWTDVGTPERLSALNSAIPVQ
ncbi:nucleotidyltransferase family protein [Ramlibacter sp. PS4R-6]|uniref:nucleotidyltransferase family protein n=1 Tax=Ramlibacter sp. PS4R-6 TaxID=3133438 RepID=UPI0030B09FA6